MESKNLITNTSDVEGIIAELNSMPIIAVDTETEGLDPYRDKLLLLQIGNLEKQFIIDCRKASPEPLRGILEGQKPKVLQNAKFDYKMIKHAFNIEMENMIDTMLIEQVLTSGLSGRRYGLADLAEYYLKTKLDKTERESFINHTGEFSENQLTYAQNDLIFTLQILNHQMPMVIQDGLEHTVKLECLAIGAFGDMEYNGILLDKEKWCAILEEEKLLRSSAKEKIDKIFMPHSDIDLFGMVNINYDSEEQLRSALENIGINVSDTSKATLSKIQHPIGQLIIDYREHQKVVSSYGQGFLEHIHPITGRIHPLFKQIGASSGRTSCTEPNLQNIKADSRFRSCFIAPEGRKLIVADYSGCELRIIAELSGDPVFLETFRNGGDLHSIVATEIFRKNVSKNENPELRQKAKVINFGLAYGMGAQGLSAALEISEDEAKELLDKYFQSYPLVKRYLDKSAEEAIQKGYSVTIGGRRRYYEIKDKKDSKAIASIARQAKNAPIQGTNADMTKLALIWIRNKIKEKKLNAMLVNTVHDEIVLECDEQIAEDVADITRNCMIKAGEYYLSKLPVEVECSISECWEK